MKNKIYILFDKSKRIDRMIQQSKTYKGLSKLHRENQPILKDRGVKLRYDNLYQKIKNVVGSKNETFENDHFIIKISEVIKNG